MPIYLEGEKWKIGKPLLESIRPTPELIKQARSFLIQKWKERAAERGRPEPDDLTGACKFASLFAQAVFGGELKGNWNHQYVVLPTGEKIDLTAGMTSDQVDYTHDEEFWNNPEHAESMRSCAPRVNQWAVEFKRKFSLREYLSNNTSDFSDGTNGEPTGYTPSGGDAGTAVGLPDYKYLERKKRRHEKLRALQQRRDPDGVSANPVDISIRSALGERLSAEEMAILKSQTKRRPRRRYRLREDDEEDAVKDVALEPAPTYTDVAGKSFGWALNLGSEREITQRSYRYGPRLGKARWNQISDDYGRVERNVLAALNKEAEHRFTDEGHSDDDLVGSGWIIPMNAPELWRIITSVPEHQYVDLLAVGYLIGITPEEVYARTSILSRRLLKPMLMFFDIKDYKW